MLEASRSLPFAFVTLLAGLAPAQEASIHTVESTAAAEGARVVAPGPRWTGRYIVRVRRDAAEHRTFMKALGSLRRAKSADALQVAVADYEARMSALQLPVIELARELGAEVIDTNWLVNAVGIQGASEGVLLALASHPDVVLIEPDEWREAQLAVATDAAHHNSDKANTLLTSGGVTVQGDGVTIAIIDSGVDADHAGSGRPHAAFFPNGDPTQTTGAGLGGSRLLSATEHSAIFGNPAEDLCGHGTRMASIAAGAAFNALPDVDDGPAPRATLRSLKITDDNTFGSDCLASVLSMNNAFQAAVTEPDVSVANMSYDGTVEPTLSPNPAIADAALADIFITVSAGNFGSALSFAHGSYNALVVGASHVDSKEPMSIFGVATSAIGPLNGRVYPQLLAVGESVTCAEIDNETGAIDSTGTSGAAAFVAGTAALVRQADPTLSALEVRALLLNTSETVLLGNPDAAGYGYLRSDRAVEDALAGLVVSQVVTTGQIREHARLLQAGQEAAFTLTWFREGAFETTIDDLDLRVRDPQGNLIAWSASTLDNTEQIRFTASQDGLYTVEVIPIVFDGDGTAEYALAGVDVESFDPGTCVPGAPTLAAQSPPAIPTITQALEWSGFGGGSANPTNQVTLYGCNFTGTAWVTVGGNNLTVQVIDDNTMTFNLGVAPAVGAVPITIVGSSGVGNGTITVAPTNTLATTPTVDFGKMWAYMAGPPNHFYAIAFSPSLIPTTVPGLLSVDIGNGGQSLYPVVFGNLNGTNGVEIFEWTGISGAAGDNYHFQGITLDNTAPIPPWNSTNPSTVLFFL